MHFICLCGGFNGGQPLLKELKKKNGNKKKKMISDIIAQCLHPLVVVVEVVMQFLKNCLITIKCAGVQDKLHFFY